MTLPGLNIQKPWCQYILDGLKTIETRHYPLPSQYVGKPILLIETPGELTGKASIKGIVVFGESYLYRSKNSFYADSSKHLIRPTTTTFNWKPRKQKWAWPVLTVQSLDRPLPKGLRRGIVFTKEIEISGF